MYIHKRAGMFMKLTKVIAMCKHYVLPYSKVECVKVKTINFN